MNVTIQHVGNTYIRRMKFAAGEVEPGHSHPLAHTTFVGIGLIRLTKNGATSVFKAGAMIWIEENVVHSIEALEPSVVLCIHALTSKETGEILDPDSLPADGSLAGIGKLTNDPRPAVR